MDIPTPEQFQRPTPTPLDQMLFAMEIAIVVFCLVWLYRDARARDADPILWTIALAVSALFIHWALPIVGVVIYLFVRPKGKLGRCPHCGSGHIDWFTICPKCEGPLKRDCRRCHAVAPWNATECPECNARL